MAGNLYGGITINALLSKDSCIQPPVRPVGGRAFIK